jgi:hypothetical protein
MWRRTNIARIMQGLACRSGNQYRRLMDLGISWKTVRGFTSGSLFVTCGACFNLARGGASSVWQ